MPWGSLIAPAMAMLHGCAAAGGTIHLTDAGLAEVFIGLGIIGASQYVKANARARAARQELGARQQLWSLRTWEDRP